MKDARQSGDPDSYSSSPDRTAVGSIDVLLEVESGREYGIIVECIDLLGSEPKTALLEISALDADGNRLTIAGWPTKSEKYGDFTYLEVGEGGEPAITLIWFNAPLDAVRVHLKGRQWRAQGEVEVVGELLVHAAGQGVPPFETANGTALSWPASLILIEEVVPERAHSFEVQLDVQAPSRSDAKSPFIIVAFDADGARLMPPSNMPQNPVYGAYIYLQTESGGRKSITETVELPSGTSTLQLHGIGWGIHTALLGAAPSVTFNVTSETEMRPANEPLSNKAPLIIIDSTAPPLGDDTRRLRPNNLAYEYSAAGLDVLFLPFGSLQGHPRDIVDGIEQIDRGSAGQRIEELATSRDGLENIYLCTSFPSLENVSRAEYLKGLGWHVVYEVRDDMEEFNRVGYSKWYHPSLERQMLLIADLVVTVSPALTRKMESMSVEPMKIHTIPNGVAVETIQSGLELRRPSILPARNASRKIGYVGHLTESWFDWEIVLEAAKARPDLEFELIGHGMPPGIALQSNMKYLGAMTHAEIMTHARTWKVGIIPFIASPLTRGVDPNKIYEYFAWGMRVVSAPMGSVDKYPSTWVYRNASDFIDAIEEAINSDYSLEELASIDEFCMDSSWRNRAKDMLNLMGIRA